jgi:hypothetical protein
MRVLIGLALLTAGVAVAAGIDDPTCVLRGPDLYRIDYRAS